MTRSFRFMPLSTLEGGKASTASSLLSAVPNDPRSKTGLHFIFCHANLLKPNKGGEVLECLLAITGTDKGIRDWDRDAWVPSANSVIVLDTLSIKDLPKQAVAAIGKLRIALYGEVKFQEKPVFVLCHPVIQDLSGYPDLVSHTDSDGYCLWDDGGLWEASAWQGDAQEKKILAWRGAGWSQAYIAAEQGHDNLAFSSLLESRFNRSIEDLDLYGRSLLDYVTKHDDGHLPLLNRRPGASYVAALLEFLPGYYPVGKRDQRPLPCHSAGGYGGPMPWPGIAALHQHLRHLFLDGWLTLWPVGDELYLQPASLALLYWAARWADKPFTKSPGEFIECYAWDKGEWFGGHWKGLNLPESDHG